MALALGGAVLAGERISGTVRVIDGDTLDVGGTRVRLHGIDAPEAGQTCTRPGGAVWECGAWVTGELTALAEGRWARCEQMDTDRYGRAVARCEIGGEDLGAQLVSSGLAFAFRRYSMTYDPHEKAAAVAGLGLWSSQVQRPAEYRGSRGSVAPDPGCALKGNISAKGTRIYHMPGQADYGRTVIDPSKGERWFCSESEARAAGWRRAAR